MGTKKSRIAMVGAAAALAVVAQSAQAQSNGAEGYGDFVWNDLNQNGIQDAGEAGIGNVLVSLFSNADNFTNPLTTSLTDASGHYFLDIGSGGSNHQYIVQFSLPSGYQFSLANQGGNDALDSDVLGANGRTATLFGFNFPFGGGGDLTVDAGMFIAQVPEPTILPLVTLALGLAGFSARVRRR